MTTHDPVERLLDAINSHDPQRVAECFTPDYRAEMPHRPAENFVGSDRVAANWAGLLGRIPDLTARVLRRAEAGAELWSEWEMTGTGPDGRPALLCGPVIMTTRDGRVASTRFYLAPVVEPAGG
jgi:ketosteroid isomerase-like protein